MKKLCCFLALLLTFTLFASPEFHGNFLAALEKPAPRDRVSIIISAMESADTSQWDDNALKVLAADLNRMTFEPALFDRLVNLLGKYPSNHQLAKLIMPVAVSNQYFPKNVTASFAETVMNIDMKQLDKKSKEELVPLMAALCNPLLNEGQIQRNAQIFDVLFSKYSDDPTMIYFLASWAVYSGFFIDHTAPYLNGYNLLPENNFWKLRHKKLAEALTKIKISSDADAVTVLAAMDILYLPQTPEKYKELQRKFTFLKSTWLSKKIAQRFKRPDLLNFRIENEGDLVMACQLKKFLSAKIWIRKQKKRSLRDQWMIVYFCYKKEYAKAQKLIENVIHWKNTNLLVFASANNVIHKIGSKKLCISMLEEVERMGGNATSRHCNIVGYIAADLNIELDRAEKLIRLAVKKDPFSEAYRDSLAWVLFRQGKFAEAEKEINFALRYRTVLPSTSILLFHAAEIQLALGNKARAAEYFRRAKFIHDPQEESCSEYTPVRIENLENRLK